MVYVIGLGSIFACVFYVFGPEWPAAALTAARDSVRGPAVVEAAATASQPRQEAPQAAAWPAPVQSDPAPQEAAYRGAKSLAQGVPYPATVTVQNGRVCINAQTSEGPISLGCK